MADAFFRFGTDIEATRNAIRAGLAGIEADLKNSRGAAGGNLFEGFAKSAETAAARAQRALNAVGERAYQNISRGTQSGGGKEIADQYKAIERDALQRARDGVRAAARSAGVATTDPQVVQALKDVQGAVKGQLRTLRDNINTQLGKELGLTSQQFSRGVIPKGRGDYDPAGGSTSLGRTAQNSRQMFPDRVVDGERVAGGSRSLTQRAAAGDDPAAAARLASIQTDAYAAAKSRREYENQERLVATRQASDFNSIENLRARRAAVERQREARLLKDEERKARADIQRETAANVRANQRSRQLSGGRFELDGDVFTPKGAGLSRVNANRQAQIEQADANATQSIAERQAAVRRTREARLLREEEARSRAEIQAETSRTVRANARTRALANGRFELDGDVYAPKGAGLSRVNATTQARAEAADRDKAAAAQAASAEQARKREERALRAEEKRARAEIQAETARQVRANPLSRQLANGRFELEGDVYAPRGAGLARVNENTRIRAEQQDAERQQGLQQRRQELQARTERRLLAEEEKLARAQIQAATSAAVRANARTRKLANGDFELDGTVYQARGAGLSRTNPTRQARAEGADSDAVQKSIERNRLKRERELDALHGQALREDRERQKAAEKIRRRDEANALYDTVRADPTRFNTSRLSGGREATSEGTYRPGTGPAADGLVRENRQQEIRTRQDVIKALENEAKERAAQARRGNGSLAEAFLGGATSRGVNGQGGGFNREGALGLAASFGTTVKYSAQYAALNAITGALTDTIAEAIDYRDSLTDLNVALGEGAEASAAYVDGLSAISKVAGGNVGQALDSAARGIRAFGNDANGEPLGASDREEAGVRTAKAATDLSIIASKEIPDATGDLVAIGNAFGVQADQLERINDAIAAAKGQGGDPKQIAQGLANGGVALNAAGFSYVEAAQLISRVVLKLDQSGQASATRISRITAALNSTAGRNLKRDLGLDPNIGGRDALVEIGLRRAGKGDGPKLTDAQNARVTSVLGGTSNLRELEVTLDAIGNELSGGFTNGFAVAGKAEDEVKRKSEDLAGQIKILTGTIKNVQNEVFDSGLFAPFTIGLATILPVLDTTEALLKTFNQLKDVVLPDFTIMGVGIGDVAAGLAGAALLYKGYIALQGRRAAGLLVEAGAAARLALAEAELAAVQLGRRSVVTQDLAAEAARTNAYALQTGAIDAQTAALRANAIARAAGGTAPPVGPNPPPAPGRAPGLRGFLTSTTGIATLGVIGTVIGVQVAQAFNSARDKSEASIDLGVQASSEFSTSTDPGETVEALRAAARARAEAGDGIMGSINDFFTRNFGKDKGFGDDSEKDFRALTTLANQEEARKKARDEEASRVAGSSDRFEGLFGDIANIESVTAAFEALTEGGASATRTIELVTRALYGLDANGNKLPEGPGVILPGQAGSVADKLVTTIQPELVKERSLSLLDEYLNGTGADPSGKSALDRAADNQNPDGSDKAGPFLKFIRGINPLKGPDDFKDYEDIENPKPRVIIPSDEAVQGRLEQLGQDRLKGDDLTKAREAVIAELTKEAVDARLAQQGNGDKVGPERDRLAALAERDLQAEKFAGAAEKELTESGEYNPAKFGKVIGDARQQTLDFINNTLGEGKGGILTPEQIEEFANKLADSILGGDGKDLGLNRDDLKAALIRDLTTNTTPGNNQPGQDVSNLLQTNLPKTFEEEEAEYFRRTGDAVEAARLRRQKLLDFIANEEKNGRQVNDATRVALVDATENEETKRFDRRESERAVGTSLLPDAAIYQADTDVKSAEDALETAKRGKSIEAINYAQAKLNEAKIAAAKAVTAQAIALVNLAVNPASVTQNARAAVIAAEMALKDITKFEADGVTKTAAYLDQEAVIKRAKFDEKEIQAGQKDLEEAGKFAVEDRVGRGAAKIAAAERNLKRAQGNGTSAGDIAALEDALDAARNEAAELGFEVAAAARELARNPNDELGAADDAVQAAVDALAAARAAGADQGTIDRLAIGERAAREAKRKAGVESGNAMARANIDPRDSAALAQREIQEADTEYQRLLREGGTGAQVGEALQRLRKAQIDLLNSEVENASNARLAAASFDITDPVKTADEELRKARDQQARNRNAPKAIRDIDDINVKNAEANAERAAQDDRLRALKTNLDLGRISHQEYIKGLQAEKARLESIGVLTYEQNRALDNINLLIKDAAQSLDGQFNIGDIKLPTIYQVRSSIANATGGAGAGSRTQNVNVTINGGDINQVKQVMSQYLGASAFSNTNVAATKV